MPRVVRIVAQPAEEPVSLAEAKAHLRWDDAFTADDSLIGRLIVAARRYCEAVGKITCVNTTFDLVDDGFPTYGAGSRDARAFYGQFAMGGLSYGPSGGGGSGPIDLPRSPVQSVTSIACLGPEGDEIVVSPSDYRVVPGAPGRVVPVWGRDWPTTLPQPGAVTVRFVAGYGAAATDVPENVKAAILLMVGHLYENREAVVTGAIVTVAPMAVVHLLAVEPNHGGYS